MRLTLVRHAIAAEAEGFPLGDELRPITAKGRRRFRKIARTWAEAQPAPTAVLCSPLVRAVQTAEILVEVAGYEGEVVMAPSLAPSASAGKLVAELRARRDAGLAVVGHEPLLSAVSALLLGEPLGAAFKKGMILCLDVDRSEGREARDGHARAARFHAAYVAKREQAVPSLAALRVLHAEDA